MVRVTVVTEGELSELRVLAESLMIDSCTIKRATGYDTDPNTGARVVVYGDPFYDGPCRVIMPSGTGSDVHVLAQELATQNYITVCVPASSPPALADDVLTVTASQDPALAGRSLRIESFYGQTWSVERRYVCEESTTPDA